MAGIGGARRPLAGPWSSLGLAVQASGVSANLPGDGASAASGRQPEAASAG